MRWCWVNFQCRGVLPFQIKVGQGPTALTVGAGGGCFGIFTLVYYLSFLSLSLWETEILSQRAVKTKNNQPTNPIFKNIELFPFPILAKISLTEADLKV